MEQPHVFEGDDRLIGESFEELDLRRGEGAHLGDVRSVSNGFPLLTKRNEQKRAQRPAETKWEIVLRADVGNVKRAMLANPAKLWLINTDLDAGRTGTGPKWARGIIIFPSWSRRSTSSIPQTRAALSTMASRTGCTSVGERLMMPSTSAVAV